MTTIIIYTIVLQVDVRRRRRGKQRTKTLLRRPPRATLLENFYVFIIRAAAIRSPAGDSCRCVRSSRCSQLTRVVNTAFGRRWRRCRVPRPRDVGGGWARGARGDLGAVFTLVDPLWHRLGARIIRTHRARPLARSLADGMTRSAP